MGLVRNLTAGEIAGQVRVLADALDMRDTTFNIVLMGMGEPLHNYDETMKALRILADEHGFDDVAAARSRCRRSACCRRSSGSRQEPVMPNLAISLHAPTDLQRGELVPLNQKYGVADIIDACKRFPLKRRSRITFEYVAARRRQRFARRTRAGWRSCSPGVKSKVNLIPLNAAAGHPVRAAVGRRRSIASRKILADHRRHGVGAQEPRPRHPRGLRSADRRRSEEVSRPAARRHAVTSACTRTHSLRARPGGIRTLR